MKLVKRPAVETLYCWLLATKLFLNNLAEERQKHSMITDCQRPFLDVELIIGDTDHTWLCWHIQWWPEPPPTSSREQIGHKSPIPYLLTSSGSMKSAMVGLFTSQKTANATNQRFSSSIAPVVKYLPPTTGSIPHIFKSHRSSHFVRVVLNWVGVKGGQGLEQETRCVHFEKIPGKRDTAHTHISSLTEPPKNPILCCHVLAEGLKI